MPSLDTAVLEVVLKARDEAGAALDSTRERFGLLGTAGAAAAGLTGAALAGIGVASVAMAGEFQKSLTELVTGAGESEKNLDMIRQGILAISNETGTSANELTKGLYLIESAGFHGAAGLDVLKASAEGAKVGNSDMMTTANAVTTVMKDYALNGAQGAADATNFLVGVVSMGKTHMQDLAGSMSTILPIASQLHIPLDDIGGAMATMTAHGIDADRAATYLRFTVSQLAAETPKGAKALTDIGLSSQTLSDTLTTKGLLPAMQLLEEHLKTHFPAGGAAMFESLKDITGGTRGLGGALSLTGMNMQEFVDNTASVANKVKEGKGQILGWSDVQKDFNFQFDRAKVAVENVGIAIGTQLLPVLTSAAAWIGDHLAPSVGALSTGFSLNLIPAFQRASQFVQSDVIPAVVQLWQWFDAHLVPILRDAVHWTADSLLPALAGLADSINRNVLPAVLSIGGFLVDNLIKPGIALAQTVIPPLIGVLKFLADHLWIVEVALGAVVARMLVMKAIDLAAWGIEAAQAMARFGASVMALNGEKALGGLLPNLGKLTGAAASAEGAIGTGGLAGAMAGLGPALPIVAIAALGAAIVGLATDAGGVRTSLKNAIWGEDQQAAFRQFNEALDQAHDKMVEAFGKGGQQAADSLNEVRKASVNMLTDTHAGLDKVVAADARLQEVQRGLKNGTLDVGQAIAEIHRAGIDGANKLGAAWTDAMLKSAQVSVDTASQTKTDWRAAFIALDQASAVSKANQFRDWSEIQAMHARTQNAMATAAYQSVFSQTAQVDTLRVTWINEANEEIARQGLKGAAADRFRDEFVAAHLDAFNRTNPLWGQGMALVDTYAATLHRSRQEILQMGPDAAASAAQQQWALNSVIARANEATVAYAALDAAAAAGAGVVTMLPQGGGARVGGEGGIVEGGAQHWLIGERGEKEWIIPQHKVPSSMWGAMDAMVHGSLASAGGGGGGGAAVPSGGGGGDVVTPITITLDGHVVSRQVVRHVGALLRQQGYGGLGGNS